MFKDFNEFKYMWDHGGKTIDADKRLKLSDALAVPEAPAWLPKVLNTQIAEAVEPMLIGTSLMQRIQYQPGQFITFPVASALEGDFDMAEEDEYPECRVQIAPGTTITTIGKSGCAVKFTEEILRYSSFDVIGLHVRQMARAMARFKEQKVFRLLSNLGSVTHDNVTPASSVYGTTRGRSLVGAGNGSLTMDDMFEAYAFVMNNGWVPNGLIMHPLTWLMFVQDATLRAFTMQNGGGTLFAGWSGSPAQQDPFPGQFGGQGISTGRVITPANATNGTPSAVTAYSQNLTSAPQLPGYGFGAFRIIVSPFVPFDPATNTTSIIMADLNELGFYVEDEALVTEEMRDPLHDILKIKMRERYEFAIKNSGHAIAVLKNVYVKPNEIVLPAQATIAISGSIAALNRNAAI